jgi:hypothetical protein
MAEMRRRSGQGFRVLTRVRAGSRSESAEHTSVPCSRSSPRPVPRGGRRVWLGRPVRQDASEFERDS